MAASVAPNLTWHVIDGGNESGTYALHDLGEVDVGNETIVLPAVRWRLRNTAGTSTVLSPVIYIGGADKDSAAPLEGLGTKWIYIKRINDNGESVSDIYESVGQTISESKAMDDVEPGTYVEFDMEWRIPPDIGGGTYNVEYILEYRYVN